MVVYPMPAFSFTFQAPTSSIGSNGMDFVERTLPSPLHVTTAEFLLESFRLAVAQAAQQQGTTTASSSLPPLVYHLVTLSCIIVNLQTNYDPNNNNANKEWITFYVEFQGTVSFQNTQGLTTTTPPLPSNAEMYDLTGSWMRTTFANDIDILLTELHDSDNAVLQGLQQLSIQTDITLGDANNNPFGGGTSAQLHSSSSSRSSATMILKQSILWSCLIVVAIATLISFLFLIVPVVRARRRLYNHHRSNNNHHHNQVVLPGRQEEVVSEGGDFALDPYNIYSHNNNRVPYKDNNNNDGTDDHDNVEDDFEFVAPGDGLYVIDNDSSSSNNNNNHSAPSFMQQVAWRLQQQQQRDDDDDDDDILSEDVETVVMTNTTRSGGSQNHTDSYAGNAPSWWSKLTQTLRQQAAAATANQQRLECEKDATNYDFPYQDFPRHDGTPCLMYREREPTEFETTTTIAGAATASHQDPTWVLSQVAATTTDCPYTSAILQAPWHPDDSRHSGTTGSSYTASSHLTATDQAFLRELAYQQDLAATKATETMSVSYERDEGMYDSEFEEMPFTDKLERLLAMRRRHYEKTEIIERGREERRRRRREMEEEEARLRELKLRRHEMELDLTEIEAEAALTPRALTRKSYATATNQGKKNWINNMNHAIAINYGGVSNDDMDVAPSPQSGPKSHRSALSDSDLVASVLDTSSCKMPALPPRHHYPRDCPLPPPPPRTSPPPAPVSYDSDEDDNSGRRLLKRYSSSESLGGSTSVTHSDSGSVSSSGGSSRGSGAGSVRKGRHYHHHHHHRHGSHRRIGSHGTEGSLLESKGSMDGDGTCLDNSKRGKAGEDVMTFGIAAYTHLV